MLQSKSQFPGVFAAHVWFLRMLRYILHCKKVTLKTTKNLWCAGYLWEKNTVVTLHSWCHRLTPECFVLKVKPVKENSINIRFSDSLIVDFRGAC